VKSDKNIPENDDLLSFLSKEKQLSDHILNNSRSMISVINRDYVYEKVNTTFCKALKGVADSILGKTLSDVWGYETFRENIKGNIDKCFSGAIIKYEASFNTPQAGRRFFEVVFRPFPVDSGEITHLLAETFDITDLKLSEKIAFEKEEEFRKFETNLPIGFLRCRPDGKIFHVNRAFILIMECNGEDTLHRRNLKDYYADEGIFELHLQQLVDSRPKSFGRVPLKTCKGNEIVCRISAFMTMDESSKPSYIDFAFEDSSRELMLENRLLQAQKLETIGSLAGGIAHDFNNILTTISGYSELLQEDIPKTSASYQRVARIKLAVSKARSLTNQILTFSRQVEQEKVIVNVYDVLQETIGFIKSAAPKNVTIRSNIRKKNSPVFADPTQLFRVFLNLMTNAIQSLDERKGLISVSLAVVSGKKLRDELDKMIVADEYILVTFKDTGKGMDPSLLRRIFEPFFTTREVGKGSGLGLSVVHGIVTEMGGEVLVSSEKDKGSSFYVYLPVSGEETNVSGIREKRKRILFIMGNKHESRILSLALESAGYELVQASDIKLLSSIISEKRLRPDLIIFMSDAEKIKAEDLLDALQNSGSEVPCILIDDPDLDFREEKLVNSGIVSQHLIKPVSLKEIKNAIQLSIK
jgi:signal transduction histidine kinase/CheY-like chemotaxis protein